MRQQNMRAGAAGGFRTLMEADSNIGGQPHFQQRTDASNQTRTKPMAILILEECCDSFSHALHFHYSAMASW